MNLKDNLQKLNTQRFTMVIILCNVLESLNVPYQPKAAVAASLLEMMDSCMDKEDKQLIDLINHSIDIFCEEVENEKGIEDFRAFLLKQVLEAKDLISEFKEKQNRIKEGEDILKRICLN